MLTYWWSHTKRQRITVRMILPLGTMMCVHNCLSIHRLFFFASSKNGWLTSNWQQLDLPKFPLWQLSVKVNYESTCSVSSHLYSILSPADLKEFRKIRSKKGRCNSSWLPSQTSWLSPSLTHFDQSHSVMCYLLKVMRLYVNPPQRAGQGLTVSEGSAPVLFLDNQQSLLCHHTTRLSIPLRLCTGSLKRWWRLIL